MNEVTTQVPTTTIEPEEGLFNLELGKLWQYRDLLFFLVWRDIKVRYKQTVLGALWAILQPFLTMAIFAVIFGHFMKVPSDGIPYPIFAYTALLPWQYFAQALERSSNSLVASSNLISKVYFPRLVIPIAATLSPLVDFALAFLVLVVMMLWYHIMPTWRILLVPFFLTLAIVTSLAVSLWLSALNVKYRDVRYAIPFLIQIWMYASPIVYPIRVIPEGLRPLYSLNPMVGVIEGFRWALLGEHALAISPVLVSGGVVAVLLAAGLVYFHSMEKVFADII